MATTHYDFPTINGSDAIDLVNDYNGLAVAVDTALFAVDSAVSAHTNDINIAKDAANQAQTAANAASTNAAAAQANANAAQTTANNASATVNGLSQTLNNFMNMFNLSEVATSGVSWANITENTMYLEQNTDGTAFRFGGGYRHQSGNATQSKVTIPGGSGSYLYGVATGLTLNSNVAEPIVVKYGGMYRAYVSSSQTIYSADPCDYVIGTDGQIYIWPSNTSEEAKWTSTRSHIIWFFPTLMFNL